MAKEFPPAGTCDCHVHCIGPKDKFPLAPKRAYTPMDASVADLKKIMKRTGAERAVIVQPSIYGADNRCTMDAVDKLDGAGRAVVVLDANTPDAELDALHKRGARGIRVNAISVGENALETIREQGAAAAKLCARNGWHVQFFVSPKIWEPLADFMLGLPVDVVLDHFGLISMGPEGHDQATHLARMMDSGRVWVKLSGTYRVGKAPFDPDVIPLARRLAAANPERVVWASDWPHTPPHGAGHDPYEEHPYRDIDTAKLLAWTAEWFEDERMQTQLLAKNPAQLYGF